MTESTTYLQCIGNEVDHLTSRTVNRVGRDARRADSRDGCEATVKQTYDLSSLLFVLFFFFFFSLIERNNTSSFDLVEIIITGSSSEAGRAGTKRIWKSGRRRRIPSWLSYSSQILRLKDIGRSP